MKKYATFDGNDRLLLRLDASVNQIPSNAVEVEGSLWSRMVVENDGIWMRTSDGSIIKRDLPPLTPVEIAMNERALRDGEIEATEWLVTRHRDEQDMQLAPTLSAEHFSELLVYRQALRGWPQSENFPKREHRPIAPPWMAQLAQ